MILRETPLAGAYLVEPDLLEDERGHFARTFDAERFAATGLESSVVQSSTSFNARAGTLRGMHFQEGPHGEAKLMRVTRGAAFDVIVDLRRESPTFCAWFGVELNADRPSGLYAPPGMAHGFLTLADASEMHYTMFHPYVPDAARGVRFDDPAFAIDWPSRPAVISERDRTYPDFA